MAESKRITVFIDGPNLNQAQGRYQQGYRVDLIRLVEHLTGNRKLIVVHYYGSERGSRQSRSIRLRRAYPFQFHGFRDDKQLDVALAVDMLDEAWRDLYDIAVLVSGDKDFIRAITKIKNLSKAVQVVSFENGLASSLGREASEVIRLDILANYIKMA